MEPLLRGIMRDYSEVYDRIGELYKRTAGDIKPGLERITGILQQMDNPERAYLAIHIAGTNGKGSVAAMVESILRAAGLRTGLYTSPHLLDFTERIKIAGAPIDLRNLAEAYEKTMRADEVQVQSGADRGSFFEITTAIAFECFRLSQIDVAVIETGMGGRWDATNVVIPVISVITPISIEHSQRLGSTLAEIAFEKAGIVKQGVPLVLAEQAPEADAVFERIASERSSRIRRVEATVSVALLNLSLDGQKLKVETDSCGYPPMVCPLLGHHQIANCALAIAASEEFFAVCQIDLDPKAVKNGIENVDWPGRGQIINRAPIVMLDGAHNPGAALRLAELISEVAPKKKLGLIVSFLDDKDAAAFIHAFAGSLERCWIVGLHSGRAMPTADIERAVRTVTANCAVCKLEKAYSQSIEWANENDGIVCITGSLYLIGDFLRSGF